MATLIEAVRTGNHAQVFAVLVSGQEDINYRDRENGATPLFWAATGGHRETVELLLDYGADKEAAVKWQMTPLLAAVDRKHYRTAQLLLERGAKVNAQTQKGDTALHLAAYRGSSHLCKLLVDYGADRSFLNNMGKTAQQEANAVGHTSIIKLLAPEANCRTSVVRASSLPLSHRHTKASSEDWREKRVPSENDETLLSTNPEWKSLRRKLLKSALPPHVADPRHSGGGSMIKYHSANQLDALGRVSPPMFRHHNHSPSFLAGHEQSLSHQNHVRFATEEHPRMSAEVPQRGLVEAAGRYPAPDYPESARMHLQQIRQPAVWRGQTPSTDVFHQGDSSPWDYQRVFLSQGSPEVQRHDIQGEVATALKSPRTNGQNRRSYPGPSLPNTEVSNHQRRGSDSSHATNMRHTPPPALKQNGGLQKELQRLRASTGVHNGDHNSVQSGGRSHVLSNPDVRRTHIPSPGLQKYRKHSADAVLIGSTSVSQRPSSDNVVPGKTRPRSSGPEQPFPEVDRLMVIINQLENEKRTLSKQNEMLVQRLDRIESQINAVICTDSSSEDSWPSQSISSAPKGIQSHSNQTNESYQASGTDLEQFCAKLLSENRELRLKTMSSSEEKNGQGSESCSHVCLNDESHHQRQTPGTTHGNNDLDLFNEARSSEATSPSSSLSSAESSSSFSSSSMDYPHGNNNHLSSPKGADGGKITTTRSNTGEEKALRERLDPRSSFLTECWHSLNSTYLSFPFQARSLPTAAMQVNGAVINSSDNLTNIKQLLLQTMNREGDEDGDDGDVQTLLEGQEIDIVEKVSQTSAPDGSVAAVLRCKVDSRLYIMKVKYSSNRASTSKENIEGAITPHHPHLHLPVASWDISSGVEGSRLLWQLLSHLQMDPDRTPGAMGGTREAADTGAGAGYGSRHSVGEQRVGSPGQEEIEDAVFHCTLFPDLILNCRDLFQYGRSIIPTAEVTKGGANTSSVTTPPPPLLCSEACILRILLQLLLGVEHLHGVGVACGKSIQSACVYVSEEMRVVLGGLENARRKEKANSEEVRPAQDNAKEEEPRIDEKEDVFSVGATVCSLMQRRGTSSPKDAAVDASSERIVGNPPDWLSPSLKALLTEMLDSDAENRPPVKLAILRTATLLYGPQPDEISTLWDCEEWLLAQALRLLVTSPKKRSDWQPSGSRTCKYHLNMLDCRLCREYILRISPSQLWELSRQNPPP